MDSSFFSSVSFSSRSRNTFRRASSPFAPHIDCASIFFRFRFRPYGIAFCLFPHIHSFTHSYAFIKPARSVTQTHGHKYCVVVHSLHGAYKGGCSIHKQDSKTVTACQDLNLVGE